MIDLRTASGSAARPDASGLAARLGVALAVLGLTAALGCGKKKAADTNPPPEVTGLAAVPATAQVVIGADVAKLSDSALVARAVDQLLMRDVGLATRWAEVRDGCKIDPSTQIKRVMLALGPPPPKGATGTGPVLMVATTTVAEPDLEKCLRSLVGKGGGTVTTTTTAGRSLYQVKDGNRSMFFAYGRADTVVLGTSETWVADALGTGAKAMDNPELAPLLRQVDQKTPVWAVGRVDDRIRTGLVRASGGKLSAGPSAIIATADPTDGAKLDLAAVMATPDDAKALESFANNELKVVTMVAQMKSLGAVVAKITVSVDGSMVRFKAPLDIEDVNQLLSVLDEKPAAEQISPPPATTPGTTTPPATPDTTGTTGNTK